jgi:hypothetical protein
MAKYRSIKELIHIQNGLDGLVKRMELIIKHGESEGGPMPLHSKYRI